MDSLTNLINNIPSWVLRLDELNGQIEQRQKELAQVAHKSSSPPTRSRSVKNRGSTESLKPKDEVELEHALGNAAEDKALSVPPADGSTVAPLQEPSSRIMTAKPEELPPSSPTSESKTPATLQRQTNQVMEVVQAKAQATLKKRNRTASMISAEGTAIKYRTRSMIIVYYDSYVQSFFEELVKFVSASRNLMRKAKMAAKVAQIKRIAEMELPDDGEPLAAESTAPPGGPSLVADAPLEVADQKDDEEVELPPLKFTSSRNIRAFGRSAGMLPGGRPIFPRAGASGGYSMSPGLSAFTADQPDVYDQLDKGLEFVQSMCEHAAHQFLRDGDCNEEIVKVKKSLTETKEMADKEAERIKKEDPDALKPSEEPTRSRSFRPQSMRRELTPASSSITKEVVNSNNALEVDEGIDDMEDEPPKLVYKSTRAMR